MQQREQDKKRIEAILEEISIVISLSFKGGVGKTTLITTLTAYIASEMGWPCLLIDCDLQANASSAFLKTIGKPTLVDVLRDQATLDQAIVKVRPNLWLLPSDTDLDQAANYITGDERKLRRLLYELLLKGGMLDRDGMTRVLPKFIGFDTASLTSVTKAALLCGKELLIPLQFEFFSFQGVVSMMKKIASELDKLDHGLDIAGVIPFLVNERRKMSVRYFRSLRNNADLKDIIYPAVHVDGDIPKAQENALTILEYAPRGRGALELTRVAKYYLKELKLDDYIAQLEREAEEEEAVLEQSGQEKGVKNG